MHNRYIMLLLVLTIGVSADQWTKDWADRTLGTLEHPVPVRVTPQEAGRALGDVLQQRFELTDGALAELRDLGPRGVTQLFARQDVHADVPAFPVYAEQPRLAYYWAFHHESLERPPRRVPSGEQAREHLATYGGVSLEVYLQSALSYLEDSKRARVLEQWIYPVVTTSISLDTKVEEDEVYLLSSYTVSVVDGLVQLRYTENPGAAWGVLSGQPKEFRRWFFLCTSIIAFIVLGVLFLRLPETQVLSARAFAWILAGAIGNFIDRMRFEYVIDFVDMYTGDLHWPTYNVADVEISFGVALLVYDAIRHGGRSYLAGADIGEEAEER